MSLSYLSVLRPFLFSCKNVFFSVAGGGGGGVGGGAYKWDLLFIPPANFVCGGYTVFTLSVHACVHPCVRP